MDFLNNIGNAFNPNSNGVSNSLNSNGLSTVFNNNTIPNSFSPIVNPISPSVSNIFKTVQQNLNNQNIITEINNNITPDNINKGITEIKNNITPDNISNTINKIKVPPPPRGLPPPPKFPPIKIPKLVIPPPDQISPIQIFNEIKNNPTISPIINQSKNIIPEPLKPIEKTITSSLPNSITPQDITKAATNLIDNNITAPIDKTIISPIEKGFEKYIVDPLANLPSLFGGGLNSGDSSTYLIIGAVAIGAYLLF